MSIGIKVDIREEMMTASREPVATDKGAIAQWLVVVRGVPIRRVRVEERNDDVGDFLGEALRDSLRDGRYI